MVSVIISAYNCNTTIKETIASILDAGSIVNEIVICNDFSSDETALVLDRIKNKWNSNVRLVIVNHLQNLGGSSARNTAIYHTSNDLIFCIDSDNILIKDSINHLYDFYKKNNWIDILSCSNISFFVDIPFLGKLQTHTWIFPQGIYTLEDHLSNAESPASSGNYFFTKEIWIKCGNYRIDSQALDSWTFGFDALCCGAKMYVININNLFYKHRYGIESYYVRTSRYLDINYLAKRMILTNINFNQNLLSNDFFYNDLWFTNLNKSSIIKNHLNYKQTIIKSYYFNKFIVRIIIYLSFINKRINILIMNL